MLLLLSHSSVDASASLTLAPTVIGTFALTESSAGTLTLTPITPGSVILTPN